MKTLRRLATDKKGATAIEYGLIVALIAIAAITALSNLGGTLNTTFEKVKTNMAAGK